MSRTFTLSQRYPRESRLFANEVMQGAPHLGEVLAHDVERMVSAGRRVLFLITYRRIRRNLV